jgi:hypothetical protein
MGSFDATEWVDNHVDIPSGNGSASIKLTRSDSNGGLSRRFANVMLSITG